MRTNAFEYNNILFSSLILLEFQSLFLPFNTSNAEDAHLRVIGISYSL